MSVPKPAKGRKALSSLLCSVLAGTSVMSAAISPIAADDQIPQSYSGQDGAHTFTKVSHPDKGSGQNDGLVDYIGNGYIAAADQGQGDRGQSYSWAAQAYGDWVYVGTCYAAMGNTLNLMDSVLGNHFNKDTMTAALDAAFRGTFFVGQENNDEDSSGILVKINVKTGEVKVLMSKKTTGQVPLFRNAMTYNGKMYFCGSVSGLPAIYQIDPEQGDKITMVHQGMSAEDMKDAYAQKICTGIRGMTEFNGQLIVSCVGKDGPYILSGHENGNGGIDFKQIASKTDLYDYAAYHYSDSIYGGSIWEIIPFNGHLYVALCTGTQKNRPDEDTMRSFAIVRGDQNTDGSWNWRPVIGDQADGARYTFGIDPQRTRAGACNLVVYKDHLYIGEYNDEEIALEDVLFDTDFTFMAKNLEQSVNLYRMDGNENIELVVGDPTDMFPGGGISGIGSGFGRHENQYIWQMKVYNDKLYVGTFDTSSLLYPVGQISSGDLFRMSKEEWQQQFMYLRKLAALLIRDWTGTMISTADLEGESAAVSLDLTPEQLEELRISSELLENEPRPANEDGTELESFDLGGWMEQGNEAIQTAKDTLDLNAGLADLCAGWVELDQSRSGDPDLDEAFNRHSEFAKKYKELYEKYQALKDKLPEAIRNAYDKILNAQMAKKFDSLLTVLKYTRTAERGFDLYTTGDGVNFQSVTTNGFNDPYNHGLRTFAKTADNQLVIGTANPFYGTQIWKLNEGVNSNPGTDKPGNNKPGTNTGSSSSAQASAMDLYRLYNPNSGEHFYTQDRNEKDYLVKASWKYEGIGWTSPAKGGSSIPVYRLYNPNAGDHHYTKDSHESEVLQSLGWKYEGIGWYSLPEGKGVPVYRQYNPNAKKAGAHNYTKDKAENDYLASIGWKAEGVAWRAVK